MRSRIFKGPYLAVVLGLLFTLGSLLVIETACYFLNRSRLKNLVTPYKIYQISGLPDQSKREFAVPVNYALRPKISSGDGFAEMYQPDLLDTSGRFAQNFIPKNYHETFDFLPDATARSFVKVKGSGENIYDVVYHSNHFGQRVVPDANERLKKKHLILFGCSFVFGEGVNDQDTLPARVAEESKVYQVFNLGVPGGSIASLLAKIENGGAWSGIKMKEGAAVYVFIDDHLKRALGAMSILGEWGEYSPYIAEISPGEFKYLGPYIQVQEWKTSFYKWFWRREFTRFFKMDFPFRFSQSDLALYARMILKAKNAYNEAFPGQPFYVAFYPGHMSGTGARFLVPELEKLGISYLDYSEFQLDKYTDKKVRFKYDGHPTPEANRIFAEQLVSDLKL